MLLGRLAIRGQLWRTALIAMGSLPAVPQSLAWQSQLRCSSEDGYLRSAVEYNPSSCDLPQGTVRRL